MTLATFAKHELYNLGYLARYPWLFKFKWQKPSKQKNAVLLISLPRSGSSWIGSLLGAAENALYLREPVTQTYRQKTSDNQSVFDVSGARTDRISTLVEESVYGAGKLGHGCLRLPHQWKGDVSNKTRVIKEVNPFLLTEYAKLNQDIKVIVLLRHPAAILNSYYAQGWTGDAFKNTFSADYRGYLQAQYQITGDENYWVRGARYHYVVQQEIIALSKQFKHSRVISYESVCESPESQIKSIFEFADLPLDDKVARQLSASTQGQGQYEAGQYDLKRDTKAMIHSWKSRISQGHFEDLRRAYLELEPSFYNSAADWSLETE